MVAMQIFGLSGVLTSRTYGNTDVSSDLCIDFGCIACSSVHSDDVCTLSLQLECNDASFATGLMPMLSTKCRATATHVTVVETVVLFLLPYMMCAVQACMVQGM